MSLCFNSQRKNNPVFRYWVLVGMVLIAGFSQGMLLPVLAVMLETSGVSASANGLNVTLLISGFFLYLLLLRNQ